ncbi:MAG: SPW repeat protein [Gammaproteobacteria bacterium]
MPEGLALGDNPLPDRGGRTSIFKGVIGAGTQAQAKGLQMCYRTRMQMKGMPRKIDRLTVANAMRLIVGLWVLDSPFLYPPLGVSPATVWNYFIVGGSVVVLAAMRLVFIGEAHAFRVAHLLLGLWLTFSPWIFNYVDDYLASWNSIASGTVIAILATWGLMRDHRT